MCGEFMHTGGHFQDGKPYAAASDQTLHAGPSRHQGTQILTLLGPFPLRALYLQLLHLMLKLHKLQVMYFRQYLHPTL